MTFHKKITMRNVATVLLSAFFLSCEEPSNIGFDVLGNSALETYFTDTLTVERSTLLLDSTSTSRQTQILVGGYDDPLLGHIETEAYLQFSLPTIGTTVNKFSLGATAIIDSVTLRLVPSEYLLGDTLSKLTIGIHRLNNSLNLTKNYNHDETVAYAATPLATKSFNLNDIYTVKRDTLKFLNIKLPLSIGEELLKLGISGVMDSTNKFSDAFPGFAIKPSSSNSKALYGIKTSSGAQSQSTSILLYYHLPSETTASVFVFESGTQRFTNIKSDRSGTVLKNLTQKSQPIPSSQTNGLSFLQVGNGISTKFHFPTLKNINSKAISSASLVVEIDSTLISGYSPISLITIAEVDAANKVLRDASNTPVILTYGANGAPQPILYVSATKTYTMDVTNYVQEIMNGTKINNGFVVLPASLTTTSALVLTNPSVVRTPIKSAKLKVYYSKK